jgi:hypothetical protein
VVLNRAVGERVRTDEAFGREYARPDSLRDAMRTSTKMDRFGYRPGRVAGKFALINGVITCLYFPLIARRNWRIMSRELCSIVPSW